MNSTFPLTVIPSVYPVQPANAYVYSSVASFVGAVGALITVPYAISSVLITVPSSFLNVTVYSLALSINFATSLTSLVTVLVAKSHLVSVALPLASATYQPSNV